MKILWQHINRQTLSLKLQQIKIPNDSIFVDTPQEPFDVVIGSWNGSESQESFAPSVIIVGESRKELFSWMSTYAEDLFPLSQFSRIISLEDLINIQENTSLELHTVHCANPIWSSIVLGEILGQLGSEPDVASVPLSRVSACFSFAVARTALLYPNQEAPLARCIERLSFAETDSKFARRNITIELLIPIWDSVESAKNIDVKHSGLLDSLVGILDQIDLRLVRYIRDNHLLLSDSAEDRVKGFDLVMGDALSQRDKTQNNHSFYAILLALAALVAGRSTSHIKLLTTASKDFPEIFVWYGFFAGVAGSHYWDKTWAQQVRGVDRALRQFFRIDEPLQADISWYEYEWLSSTYNSIEMLSQLPRNYPSGLTIEIFPGIECQFRLKDNRNSSRNHSENFIGGEPITKPNTPNFEEISKAISMLTQAQQLLQGSIGVRQGNLFDNPSPPKPAKSRRTKVGDVKPKKT